MYEYRNTYVINSNIILCRGEHDILTGGADRTIQVYDSRNWRQKLKWRTPCKYDIVKLLPAADETRNRGVYVCGLDNEILLCDVNSRENKAAASTKGEKRKFDDGESKEAGLGPAHAVLPDSSKLRISHHRFV